MIAPIEKMSVWVLTYMLSVISGAANFKLGTGASSPILEMKSKCTFIVSFVTNG